MIYYPVYGVGTTTFAGGSQDDYLRDSIAVEKDVEGLCHTYRSNLYRNIRFLDAEQQKKCILVCHPCIATAAVLAPSPPRRVAATSHVAQRVHVASAEPPAATRRRDGLSRQSERHASARGMRSRCSGQAARSCHRGRWEDDITAMPRHADDGLLSRVRWMLQAILCNYSK